MNDVPLIKTNSINDINTSLIAIKKQLKQLNEALGLVDAPDVDTSVFVKKSDVVDVVESGNMNPVTSNAVVPVDGIERNNMKAATSNAVSYALSYFPTEQFTGRYWLDNKPIYAKTYGLSGTINSSSYTDVGITQPLNIDKLLDYEVKGDNHSKFCYLGNISPNLYNMACFQISSLVVTGMTCTLFFTKTTD